MMVTIYTGELLWKTKLILWIMKAPKTNKQKIANIFSGLTDKPNRNKIIWRQYTDEGSPFSVFMHICLTGEPVFHSPQWRELSLH